MPEKFEKWRPNQEAALELMLRYKDKRVKGLCMPTGDGKTAVYMAYALITGAPTCFVTATKGLQRQNMDDYASIGLVNIEGRRNYKCSLRPEYSCEEGYAAQCPMRGSHSCPSSSAEMTAATSFLVQTNYAKWTASKKYGTGMSHFTQVVFDEAHHCPRAISDAMMVELHHKEIEETLKVPFLGYPDCADVAEWKPWAVATRKVVDSEIKSTMEKITSARGEPKPTWIKHLNHMKMLMRRLGTVSTANAKNWVVDQTDDGFKFDPIRPARYGEATLLLGIPSVIMMSATQMPKTLHMSGVGTGGIQKSIAGGQETANYIFVEYDSDFNVADCPIYYIPTQSVDNRHPDRSMLWMRLDQWLARRQDRKGIVHTVSHARREEILASSRFASMMIFNAKGEAPAAKVQDFKNAGPGTNLVSPSVGEGYDFPGDLCEHNFMTKVPFEPPSLIVKAREHDDPEYRGYQALQTMIQAFGRGNRFKGDPCESAIPDDNMAWFIRKFGYLATRSFHRRYRPVGTVPPPLPKYRGT